MALKPNEVIRKEHDPLSAQLLENLIDEELKNKMVGESKPEVTFRLENNFNPDAVKEVEKRFIAAGWTGAKFTQRLERRPGGARVIEIYLAVLPSCPER